IAIAESTPDTGARRATLERAYSDARRIALTDVDRQRSRDAMLAAVALRLGRADDVRALFARLSDIMDLRLVVATAAGRTDGLPMVRELAPRVVRAGRAIRDSTAREVYLVTLWPMLKESGGRPFADSLLPEATWRAEHPRDLRAMMDSAKRVDTSASVAAMRAIEAGDFAEARRQAERIPLNDRLARRAGLLAEMAWGSYMGHGDTARTYLREARAALLAAPRDSAVFDERALRIASHQFWLGDNDEGVRTLDLVRNPDEASYVVSQWGTSTMSGLTARKLRAYADRVRSRKMRDLVLLHAVTPYLVARSASDSDAAWGLALADSIGTPVFRREAQRAVANHALERRDSTDARRRIVALLRDPLADAALRDGDLRRSLVADLVRAGGWRDALDWARLPSAPAVRARRLLGVAAILQQQLDQRSGNHMLVISNGPDWCRDEF
ncbi:MAG TPA: hypothetical protein VFN38_06865, partial [Gemmatimonadaceae bacterium]|nr:hypothetical protein [Gemmatimonadaceae bacterium]